MCGIAGIINLNKEEVDQVVLQEMITKIRYRGPDDEGFFVKKNVGFGHCRLSIIDLSKAGQQPMSNEDGNIWITYNGEVYNYIELRQELKQLGHTFKSNTDTEVIIHAYEQWGEDAFKRFNGMWALAILDLNKNKVVLSRDRFSIKPLYYTISNNTFYFGSEIKQLPFSKKINLDLMFKFLKQGLIDYNDQTFFQNVFKVKPMHNMIIDLETNKIEQKRYWNYYQEETDNVIEKFKYLFEDSVKIRLRSDVPTGALLSGGLDSSSIVVTADKLTEDFSCFSVVSKEKKYSEEKFVDILVKEKGIKVKKLFLDSSLAWERLEEVISHYDEPFAGFSVIAQNQMLEKIKKETDITVLLNGQGGDEILAGYRKFFFFYLKEELKNKHYFSAFRNTLLSLLSRTVVWQVLVEPQLWGAAMRYFPHRPSPMDKIFKMNTGLESIGEAGTLKERQILDIDKYSVPILTHYEDRNSMAYSLEMRLPFLDYRLVNFSLNLANEFKIKNGWNKYILRKSMEDLPKKIAWRRFKRGFSTPEEKWLEYDFKDKIMNLFANSELDKIGMIDKNQLLNEYQKFLNHNSKMCHMDFIRFVMAELWLRKIHGKH